MEGILPLVKCDSTKGPFTLRVHPDWAPRGAPHFLELVRDGVYERTVVHRVVPKQAASFGIPESEFLRRKYKASPPIPDDPQSKDINKNVPRDPNFRRGYMSFAGGGKDSRKTDVFITYMDNNNRNGQEKAPWEVPVAEVIDGMDNVESFTTEYGDLAQFGGKAPPWHRIWREGFGFLEKEFPLIDYVGPCRVVGDGRADGYPYVPLALLAMVLLIMAHAYLSRRRPKRVLEKI